MKNPKIIFTAVLSLLALLYAAVAPKAFGVVPPPGDFYPGGNTASGQNALLSRTTGTFNTAVGIFSLLSLTDGNFCTGVGAGTLLANTADENTASGAGALFGNTTGNDNTANGTFALFTNTTGFQNTAVGAAALLNNTEGNQNTASGFQALLNNTTGNGNTAIGTQALFDSTGSSNIALGVSAGNSVTTASNVIAIGTFGADVSNSCFIGNISGADATGGDPVFVTSNGKLGTVNPPSSARFKDDIKAMNDASEAILALKPVTFRYRKEFDPKGIPQFGLVAEEVEKVNPDLVKRDRDGKLQTVRYEAVHAMLLNEFLKEHKTVQEQGATIADLRSAMAQQRKDLEATISELKNEMETLVARFKEQDAKIQKVSDQIEIRRGNAQIVKIP